jgi:hypothetical protein
MLERSTKLLQRPYREREIVRNQEPLSVIFNGGTFTIAALTTDPTRGLRIQTRHSLGRREGHAPNPELLTNEQSSQLRDAIKGTDGRKGEMDFNNVFVVRAAREVLKTAIDISIDKGELSLPTDTQNEGQHRTNLHRFYLASRKDGFIDGLDEDVRKAYLDFEQKRQEYLSKGKKAGLRNIVVEGNTVTVDVQDVNFPVYKCLALSGNSEEVLDLSSSAGTAMIVRTRDGKFVLQHRSIRNALYGDIPGASVAGMLDAKRETEDRIKGTPDLIDTNSVRGNILNEANEELALELSDFDLSPPIIGLAHDNVQIHDEILFFADSNLTSEEIKEKARTARRNRKLGDADFEEKFVMIDGSVSAIERLLTQVQCPLPPTHAAAFVSTGYCLLLEQEGVEAANKWRDAMQERVNKNYQRIDKRVAEYTQGEFHGYTARLIPTAQGLPGFEEEMRRVGLIT